MGWITQGQITIGHTRAGASESGPLLESYLRSIHVPGDIEPFDSVIPQISPQLR